MNSAHKLRSAILFFFFYAAFGCILYAVYTITIVQRDFFSSLGKQQYKVTLNVKPERALIVDRNNKALVLNTKSIAAFIIPSQIKDSKKVELFLRTHFPAAYQRFQTHKDAQFFYIARRLSNQEVELIKKSDNKEIFFLEEPCRMYPNAAAASLVGITDIDNKGIVGIEYICNEHLSGRPTTMSLECDARSGLFHFKKMLGEEGSQGKPVQLTIDSDLQFLIAEELKDEVQALGAQEGAAVVMDPSTGELLAVVSYPFFNPNSIKTTSMQHARVIPFCDAYELGSVMKTFVALALLQEKLIDTNELVDCQNKTTGWVHGVKVNTWKAHDQLTLSEIIEHSNNIGIATLAFRLGPLLYEHYDRLGFGKKAPLNWPGQQAGFVNEPSNWSKSSLTTLSFGYESRVPLINVAQGFGIIALNGVLVPCRLYDQQPLLPPQRLYDSDVIEQLKAILKNTVEKGTAHKARLQGYQVMGKTGTANMVIEGRYSLKNNVYTFAGIIQKESYQRVIVTFIKDINRGDKYASQVVAPLFEKIAQIMLIHDKIIRTEETA